MCGFGCNFFLNAWEASVDVTCVPGDYFKGLSMDVSCYCVVRCGVVVCCCLRIGVVPFICWVHLINSCTIFIGRWGNSALRLDVFMCSPLGILSLMLTLIWGMVIGVVL